MAKISGGVKPGYLQEGSPKMAKNEYGVKLDIFKITKSGVWVHFCDTSDCMTHAIHSRPCGQRKLEWPPIFGMWCLWRSLALLGLSSVEQSVCHCGTVPRAKSAAARPNN